MSRTLSAPSNIGILNENATHSMSMLLLLLQKILQVVFLM